MEAWQTDMSFPDMPMEVCLPTKLGILHSGYLIVELKGRGRGVNPKW